MASQHINSWSQSEQISLTLRDGISPWYSPQPTSTRCRTKVWKKKKMNWSFDSCCKMFVCNFCENSCSLSGQDNVKSVFSSASFTETRNCQHIFEITEDFFYFVIFTPRKKETRHLEVSHDRSLGVWCKGICKYDQSFRQGVISHNISRSHVSWVSGDLARAPRGSLWHCSTTIRRRCRPIQKLAKRSCLSVKDRWVGHRFDTVCLVCCEI